MNHKIIELNQLEFPNKLKNIKNSPQKLYLIGNKELLFEECFGIVGTRRITTYGIENCNFFTKELTLRNIPIVSGMATGTDSVAHKTCIENNGKTIAVLAGGFDDIFPKQNIKLFEEIIENNGLIITEYEKEEKTLKKNFAERNRIVSAISEGILVIEAAYRSGTSITVKFAREQGKNVFALPGRLDSCVGIGVNKLIKNGAVLTTCIEDILEYYPQFEKRKRINISSKKKICVNIKEEYKKIYNLLKEKDLYFDEILMNVEFDFSETLNILTNMQLDGIIKQEVTGEYKII